MTKIEQALSANGYIVANVDYPSRSYPIETLSEMAIGRGLSTCKANSGGKVHFVTHSLGGILVRYFLSHKTIPNLGRVVMLAPPNQGSAVVDTFSQVPGYNVVNGPAGHELGTKSNSVPLQLGPVDYPVGVIAGTKSINPILSTTLAHPDDGKVSVESTKVQGMTDFITYPVSHPFIMRKAAVVRQVLTFLGTGKFNHNEP